MAVNLQKGQKINLKKESGQALSVVTVGLGWDVSAGGSGLIAMLRGKNIDCDASAFLLTNGRLADKSDIVSFTNLTHKSKAVQHMGDNLTGEGEGDDEQIHVDLMSVPAQYDKIVFVVNIFRAKNRSQHFGLVKNAFIRIVDNQGKEFCRYNLSENYDGMMAMIFGEIYRYKGEWKFNAIGQGTKDEDIEGLARRYQ